MELLKTLPWWHPLRPDFQHCTGNFSGPDLWGVLAATSEARQIQDNVRGGFVLAPQKIVIVQKSRCFFNSQSA